MAIVDHHLSTFDPGLDGLFVVVARVLEVSISMEVWEGLTAIIELLDILLPYVPVGHNYYRHLSLLCRYLHDGGGMSNMVGTYYPQHVHPFLPSQLEHLTYTSVVLPEQVNKVKGIVVIDHSLSELK